MPAKKTTTKIIEDELRALGDLVYDDARANVRVSKDTFDKDGNQINEGGSLRDSILPYAKGKRLTMSQLDYGRWQKPKELGSVKWSPPADRNSPVVIEAIEWTGKNLFEITTFIHGQAPENKSCNAAVGRWENFEENVE